MNEETQPVINIEAALVNVQRGDVMIIKYPDTVINSSDLKPVNKELLAKRIRDMLLVNGVDIPVLVFPHSWDIIMVEKGEVKKWQDKCWFCRKDKTDSFDGEFDTYLHLDCLRDTLRDNPDHPEAKHMKYLLEDGHGWEPRKDEEEKND
ncbi:hypothetical protein LCGC14_1004360 [marine sediment metagenome]|uniref:Uncharacterized protein n=1 Tax=marine sediment metagenome TaxID=412755 RepID=A0A0F9R863_9ZZZZ